MSSKKDGVVILPASLIKRPFGLVRGRRLIERVAPVAAAAVGEGGVVMAMCVEVVCVVISSLYTFGVVLFLTNSKTIITWPNGAAPSAAPFQGKAPLGNATLAQE